MAALPGIVVPDVIAEGTTNDVLVISWIDGERLSDSSASDVRQLCDTLLSAYLIQLLETGLLHADPHPGNLMRTTDGRIAILDHGERGAGPMGLRRQCSLRIVGCPLLLLPKPLLSLHCFMS
jgi:predicted unusual protein kinase regulating ubiquinone biosynthesis (AarF/ABC1/UbiB family)